MTLPTDRPVFAIGPIKIRDLGGDMADPVWREESWAILNHDDKCVVSSYSNKKNSSLDITGMPDDDSDEVIAMDLDGVVRTININGSFTGSQLEILTFIAKCDALLNGCQIDDVSYRLIQRNKDLVPSEFHFDTGVGWVFGITGLSGLQGGISCPESWKNDVTWGMNMEVVMSDFSWSFTSESCTTIEWEMQFTQGKTA